MKIIYRICYTTIILSPIILMWFFVWLGLDFIPDGHWAAVPFLWTAGFVWCCSAAVSSLFISILLGIISDKLKGVEDDNRN